jgi:hypothetical protein
MATLYYGTLAEANTYFSERLHSGPWEDSAPADRPKALNQVRIQFDNLNYQGVKSAVYDVLYDSAGDRVIPKPSETTIIAADATQALEFPRGSGTSVPEQIKQAQWEEAILLLDGADPDSEYESVRVKRQGYSLVRTTYADDDPSVEHLLYGILSPTAWRLLKPFLLFDNSIKHCRVD